MLNGARETRVIVERAEPPGQQTVHPAEPKAKRCLLVTSMLDVGGLDEVVSLLARKLPSRGLRTAVLHAVSGETPARESDGLLAHVLRSYGIEVHHAGVDRGPDWIERWKPDVVSAHGAPRWVFETARRAGVPFVDNLHGMYSVFSADWEWHRDVAQGTDLAAIVVVSDMLRQDYLRNNPDFPSERVVSIPNGIDEDRRSRADRAVIRSRMGLADEYLFVSLARYHTQKNTFGLLTAFGELARRRPEAHLVVAGRVDDPRYCRKLLDLRASLPCRERIYLRGYLQAPEALIAAADGFLLDSFFEGWPLASMEALYAGVPVVLSDVGGAREQVEDNPARGYVVRNPLGDPFAVNWKSASAARYRPQVNHDELISAMEMLVAHRADYLARREALAAESAARFHVGGFVGRHAAVLHEAAAQKLPPAP